MNSVNRILVAESDPNHVGLFLAALTEHRLTSDTVIVRDGRETLDYLYRCGPFHAREGGSPTVIFLSANLPTLDGLQVLHRIKSDHLLKTIPVVVLAPTLEEDVLKQSYILGANAFIVKSPDAGTFVSNAKALVSFWGLINEAPPGSARKGKDPSGQTRTDGSTTQASSKSRDPEDTIHRIGSS
ncbi:MAG TPA: two-component system response regulator [Bacteroidetes bacterium]|nr:two-component system response regulator [Bacteroidota bacterium]